MWNWIQKITELSKKETPFILATITVSEGSTPRESGTKMIVLSSGKFFGTVGGGILEKSVMKDALACLAEKKSTTKFYTLCADTNQCCGGRVEVFLEIMNHKPTLYLFGAGHVGQAVCQVLKNTPFEIHLIDERKECFESGKIPEDVICHQVPWNNFLPEIKWSENNTYVAVMTFEHAHDQNIISAIMDKKAKYIGMIGSHTKWKRFQKELLKNGKKEADLQRIHSPIGLNIGGKAPKEIAISVAAELLKTLYGK